MMIRHELTLTGCCPVDGAADQYAVVVETTRIVKVEDILTAMAALPTPLFQEEITKRLADHLNCSVTTTGHHSGVKTTCSAGSAGQQFMRSATTHLEIAHRGDDDLLHGHSLALDVFTDKEVCLDAWKALIEERTAFINGTLEETILGRTLEAVADATLKALPEACRVIVSLLSRGHAVELSRSTDHTAAIRAAEERGYAQALRDIEEGRVEPLHAQRIVAALRVLGLADTECGGTG